MARPASVVSSEVVPSQSSGTTRLQPSRLKCLMTAPVTSSERTPLRPVVCRSPVPTARCRAEMSQTSCGRTPLCPPVCSGAARTARESARDVRSRHAVERASGPPAAVQLGQRDVSASSAPPSRPSKSLVPIRLPPSSLDCAGQRRGVLGGRAAAVLWARPFAAIRSELPEVPASVVLGAARSRTPAPGRLPLLRADYTLSAPVKSSDAVRSPPSVPTSLQPWPEGTVRAP